MENIDDDKLRTMIATLVNVAKNTSKSKIQRDKAKNLASKYIEELKKRSNIHKTNIKPKRNKVRKKNRKRSQPDSFNLQPYQPPTKKNRLNSQSR